METIRLEDLWLQRLISEGWTYRAAKQFRFSWAISTLAHYNRYIKNLKEWCEENKVNFPPKSKSDLVNFLCTVADKSQKPNSMLKNYSAALTHLYDVLNEQNLMTESDIKRFVTALVKSGTSEPMTKSKVMPLVKFTEMFESWPDSDKLSIKDLRLKCVTLLAISLMLRPSDIAPKGVLYNHGDDVTLPMIFKEDQIEFVDAGLKCKFLGIKNDTSRSGFEVILPKVENEKIDPVATLACYMERTKSERSLAGGAVLVTLRKPFQAISGSTVSNILSESINLAGLKGQGYSPKSFRPSGATAGVACGHDYDQVRKLGRWKTVSVFLDSYVHVNTEKSLTKDVLLFEN